LTAQLEQVQDKNNYCSNTKTE